VIAALISISASCVHGEPTYSVIYNGVWGGWKGWVSDKPKVACGAELRFEDSCGGCDDTAGNGLRLKFCDLEDWNSQTQKDIYPGVWGGWKGMKMCSPGKYIVGARVRFEDSCGYCDNTALNGLEIACRDKYWEGAETINVYSGTWGGWKPWVYFPLGHFGTAARVRFDDPGGDDTALNGIQFESSLITHNSVTCAGPPIGASDGAWWQVELNAVSLIKVITIYNPSDSCCDQRLSNAIVDILDENGTPVIVSESIGNADNKQGFHFTFHDQNVFGKTIKITQTTSENLNLAEVQVFGYNQPTSSSISSLTTSTAALTNLALCGTASGSISSGGRGHPHLAIDGNTDGYLRDGTWSFTRWWKVDFGANRLITEIVIWNSMAGDSYEEKLSNAVVEILDENDTVVISKTINYPTTNVKNVTFSFDDDNVIGKVGKAVKVYQPDNSSFYMVEVQVFGYLACFPTSSPSQQTGTSTYCTDDLEWYFQKKGRNCDWVREKPDKRCLKKNPFGAKARRACPIACSNTNKCTLPKCVRGTKWKPKQERKNFKKCSHLKRIGRKAKEKFCGRVGLMMDDNREAFAYQVCRECGYCVSTIPSMEPSVNPSSVPSIVPSASPTHSPINSVLKPCHDDPKWYFKSDERNCYWVHQSPKKHCKKKNDLGVTARRACPVACSRTNNCTLPKCVKLTKWQPLQERMNFKKCSHLENMGSKSKEKLCGIVGLMKNDNSQTFAYQVCKACGNCVV